MKTTEILRIERVNPALKKQIKLEAVKRDITMREFIILALEHELKRINK